MFPICLVSEIIYICNQRKFKYLFRRRYFCSIRLAKVKALTRLYGHLCLIILKSCITFKINDVKTCLPGKQLCITENSKICIA